MLIYRSSSVTTHTFLLPFALKLLELAVWQQCPLSPPSGASSAPSCSSTVALTTQGSCFSRCSRVLPAPLQRTGLLPRASTTTQHNNTTNKTSTSTYCILCGRRKGHFYFIKKIQVFFPALREITFYLVRSKYKI